MTRKHIAALCIILVLAVSLTCTVIALNVHFNHANNSVTVDDIEAAALTGDIRGQMIQLGLCREDAPRFGYTQEAELTSEATYASLFLSKRGICPDRIGPDLVAYEYWYDPCGLTRIVWNSATGSIVKTDSEGETVLQPAFRNQTGEAKTSTLLDEKGETVVSCHIRESLILTGLIGTDAPRFSSEKESSLASDSYRLSLVLAEEGIYPDRISPDRTEYEYWYDSEGSVKIVWNPKTGSVTKKDSGTDRTLVQSFDWEHVEDPQALILGVRPTSTFPRSHKDAPKSRITTEQLEEIMEVCGIRSLHDVLVQQYGVSPDVAWGGDYSNYEYWTDDKGGTVILVRPHECVIEIRSGTRYGLTVGTDVSVTDGWDLEKLGNRALLSELTYRRTFPNNSVVFGGDGPRITFETVKALCQQCANTNELYDLLTQQGYRPDTVQGSGTTFVEYWADDYCGSMIRFYLLGDNRSVTFISGMKYGYAPDETGNVTCEEWTFGEQTLTERTIQIVPFPSEFESLISE